jgi:hypothetical protein
MLWPSSHLEFLAIFRHICLEAEERLDMIGHWLWCLRNRQERPVAPSKGNGENSHGGREKRARTPGNNGLALDQSRPGSVRRNRGPMGAGGGGGQGSQMTQLLLDNLSKRERVERLERWRMESSSMSGSGDSAEERADNHWTRSLCAAKGRGSLRWCLVR